jgi:hypothetical protein
LCDARILPKFTFTRASSQGCYQATPPSQYLLQ